MENRFGFKDVVVVVLLVAVLASIWVAMKQYDRQWELMAALSNQTSELVEEQARLRNGMAGLSEKLAAGAFAAAGKTDGRATGDAEEGAGDPFARYRAMRGNEDFAEGDWVIDAFGTLVKNITPLVTTDTYGRRIQSHILETLTTVDPETLETVPLLAESWEVEDHAAEWRRYVDGRVAAGEELEEVIRDPACPAAVVVTFKLRKDVIFSDGVGMTAADVVFTLDLMNNPKLNAPGTRQFYDDIRSAVALDDYTVRFELRQPNYLGVGLCGNRAVLPKHFYEKYTMEEINRATGLLLGSGPYRMLNASGWKPGDTLELVKNERYWGVKPAFAKVVYREIQDDVSRLTAFRNGQIDIFAAQPEQFEDLKKDDQIMSRAEPYVYQSVPSGYSYIAWNQKVAKGGEAGVESKFSDKRVRQAMTFLTPRQAICDEIYLGYAEPATGPFARGSRQRDNDLVARGFDTKKGKALLKDAGWEDRDGDGVVENSAGEAFKFKLMYPSGSGLYEQVVLYLKDAYARAGIVMLPDPVEFSIMLERLDNQEFEAIALGWGGGAVEGDLRQTFHSSQTNKGGDNFMHYMNPALDALIDEARTTLDEEKRLKLWQGCHRILYEDQPYTFMINRKAQWFVDKRIRNVQRVTQGINDRTEWYVPAAKQKWGR